MPNFIFHIYAHLFVNADDCRKKEQGGSDGMTA